MTTKWSDERGVALPMAVFAAALLTVLLAASLTVSSAERRVLDNTVAQIDAFVLAQTGLEQFQADRSAFGFVSVPPAPYESTRVNLGGGFADVVLTQIRPSVSGSTPLYVIRSHGVVTRPTLPGNVQGERIVAQYAAWLEATMDARSAFTSLTGLHKNGGSGTITGVDECGMQPPVAGVSVPTVPGYTQNGGSQVPTGSPDIENLGSITSAMDKVTIDWEGIVDGTTLTPDVSIPGDAWPSFSDPNYWPVIKVTGDFTLPTDGRGILIVTERLTISGARNWAGVVLVGEHVVGDGNNGVSGALISGLNVKLALNPAAYAASVGQNSIGNGVKRIHYNSCYIAQALGAFGGLTAYRNAWFDNWKMY